MAQSSNDDDGGGGGRTGGGVREKRCNLFKSGVITASNVDCANPELT